MNPLAPAVALLAAEIAARSSRIGLGVDVTSLGVLDRARHLPLRPPGRISPNGSCRLFRAADGWIALNLARPEDLDLLPAWLEADIGDDTWNAVERRARDVPVAVLISRAVLLGLPAGAAGEVLADTLDATPIRMGAGARASGPPKVIDLSAMWAGPLCGAVLAAMGAAVTKVESSRRPDPTRMSTPGFYRDLNGAKAPMVLDLGDPAGQALLRDEIADADVLITGARPRAFAGLGLEPPAVFRANPGLTWVAITGYGYTDEAATRVGLGDDTAAAGGLLRWTARGEPRFLGDALADPVTGLAAAAGALRALEQGGGVLVDVALARSAAGAAKVCGLVAA